MTNSAAKPRVFVIAPTQGFLDAAVSALASSFDVDGGTDPRGIKGFAAGGKVAAVAIAANFPKPSPDQLAAVLGPATGGAAMVLLTQQVSALPPDSPFHAAIKFPVGERVMISGIRRAMRAAHSAKGDGRGAQADIELRLLRIESQNHYEVLGVEPDAGIDAIKSVYDALSLAYHPDRLRSLDEATKAAAMQLYLRIGEAYKALREPNARMRYDHALETGVDPARVEQAGGQVQTFADMSTVPAARKYLALAQKAHIAGDSSMALAHLRFAHTQDESNGLIANKIADIEAAKSSGSAK